MPKPRAIVIVCDSLGVGELPDAKDFGDEGSNTLGHVLATEHPKLPTLTRLGLLRLNTMGPIPDRALEDIGRLRALGNEGLHRLGRVPSPLLRSILRSPSPP